MNSMSPGTEPPRVGDRVVYAKSREENPHTGWDKRRDTPSLVIDDDPAGPFMQHPDDAPGDVWSAASSSLRVVERATYQPVQT